MGSKQHRRRGILRAAGGVIGLSAAAGLATAESGDGNVRAKLAQQQQARGEQVAMVSADGRELFVSPLLWVAPGTTVTWVLESGAHSSTAYAPANDKPRRIPEDAQAWDSGVLSEQGATFEYTFDVEGVYDYYCIPHESLGTVARVVAGAPDLENAPALEPPQEDIPERAGQVITAFNSLTQALFAESQ